jgi:excisionase family DNA binding protein
MVMTPARAPTNAGQRPRPRPLRVYPTIMSSEERTLFTTAEAAAMLGVTHDTVKAQIRLGQLAAERIHPRLNMLTRDAIEEYRRTHLGRQGRPKGARNKPNPSNTTEGSGVVDADVEPAREDRGGATRAQKRRAPQGPQQAEGKPREPTARRGAPVGP